MDRCRPVGGRGLSKVLAGGKAPSRRVSINSAGTGPPDRPDEAGHSEEAEIVMLTMSMMSPSPLTTARREARSSPLLGSLFAAADDTTLSRLTKSTGGRGAATTLTAIPHPISRAPLRPFKAGD